MSLDELRALEQAATPGPWSYEHNRRAEEAVIRAAGRRRALLDGRLLLNEEHDAALIVAARNALPGLLARVEAAEAAAERPPALEQAVIQIHRLEGRAQRAEAALEAAEAERDALRSFVNGLALASLLDIRRAAFAPEIGVRYTEAIRADIAGACFRLEDACNAALAASVPSGPAAGGDT